MTEPQPRPASPAMFGAVHEPHGSGEGVAVRPGAPGSWGSAEPVAQPSPGSAGPPAAAEAGPGNEPDTEPAAESGTGPEVGFDAAFQVGPEARSGVGPAAGSEPESESESESESEGGDGPTGHPAVDKALATLAEAQHGPATEQVAAYEATHRALQQTLATIDQG